MTQILMEDFKACMDIVNDLICEEVYCINSGGCAFFASELVKRMRDIGIDDYEVVVFGDAESDESEDGIADISEIKHRMELNDFDLRDIEDWGANGVSFSHVVVRWQGICWDAESPFSNDSHWLLWPRYKGSFPDESLHSIGQDAYGWNSSYCRSQDDQVRKILDTAFALLH